MQRRGFLKQLGAGAIAGGIGAPAIASGRKQWKMVTTWPKNFPGVGTGAERLAKLIGELSNGELTVKVYGAGELVPALEVFDTVARGTAQMGHAAAYYWKGKHPATQFFVTVPFGMTAQEINAWLYYGGGMTLWKEVYAPFGLLPAAAGNTGVQMAGWFNKEINSVTDLNGLKMRIPGFGAEALRRAGGTPVIVPGGEVFPALQRGTVDAVEWVGPWNDLASGLYRAAKFYYYPGWHEPGAVAECMINKEAYQALPGTLQSIVDNACRVINQDMLAEYTARNHAALDTLVNKHQVQLRRLPDAVLLKLRQFTNEAVADAAGADPLTRKVFKSFTTFRDQVMKWHDISARAFLNARAL